MCNVCVATGVGFLLLVVVVVQHVLNYCAQ